VNMKVKDGIGVGGDRRGSRWKKWKDGGVGQGVDRLRGGGGLGER